MSRLQALHAFRTSTTGALRAVRTSTHRARHLVRVVLVPGVLALLPDYAGLVDPVAPLRAACRDAVAWLVETGEPVAVVGSEQGVRVGRHLLEVGGGTVALDDDVPGAVLAVGNGSACRSEKAPGHLDERAAAYDEDLRRALLAPDPAALMALDPVAARELWADVEGLRHLGRLLDPGDAVTVDYDGDPYGVQYWVLRWARPGDSP